MPLPAGLGRIALLLVVLACTLAAVPTEAVAAESRVLIALLPADVEQPPPGAVRPSVADLIDGHPELALGMLSATQSGYSPEQALLDLTAGTRTSRGTYDPSEPPEMSLLPLEEETRFPPPPPPPPPRPHVAPPRPRRVRGARRPDERRGARGGRPRRHRRRRLARAGCHARVAHAGAVARPPAGRRDAAAGLRRRSPARRADRGPQRRPAADRDGGSASRQRPAAAVDWDRRTRPVRRRLQLGHDAHRRDRRRHRRRADGPAPSRPAGARRDARPADPHRRRARRGRARRARRSPRRHRLAPHPGAADVLARVARGRAARRHPARPRRGSLRAAHRRARADLAACDGAAGGGARAERAGGAVPDRRRLVRAGAADRPPRAVAARPGGARGRRAR